MDSTYIKLFLYLSSTQRALPHFTSNNSNICLLYYLQLRDIGYNLTLLSNKVQYLASHCCRIAALLNHEFLFHQSLNPTVVHAPTSHFHQPHQRQSIRVFSVYHQQRYIIPLFHYPFLVLTLLHWQYSLSVWGGFHCKNYLFSAASCSNLVGNCCNVYTLTIYKHKQQLRMWK